MKKTLVALVIALIFFTGPLMAQKQLYFGLAGTGLTSVVTYQNNYHLPFELDYVVPTWGGSGNVNIGFDFNGHVGIKLELGFATLGQKYDGTNKFSHDYNRKTKLNYLQIPLLFKYRTGGDVTKFYVMAGPQINLLLSASQKYLKDDAVYSDTISGTSAIIGEESVTNRYNSLDIMGRLDLGVDIQVASNLFLNIGLTMAYGLTEINASDWHFPDKDNNYHPSHNIYGGINFGINYLLPIDSK